MRPDMWSSTHSESSFALLATEIGVGPEDFSKVVIDEIRDDSESETYQFTMKSVIDSGSQAVAEMGLQISQLQAQLVRSNDYKALREAHTRLGEELDAWVAHAAELNEQIRQLHDELGLRTAWVEDVEAKADELRVALEAHEQRYNDLTSSRTFRLIAPPSPIRRLAAAS